MDASIGNACVAFMTEMPIASTGFARSVADQLERDSCWSRIAQELSNAIATGIYTPGERLPSENALAEDFGVNRHTIRRALSSLGHRGLVRSSQGSGTFVQPFAVDLALGKRPRHHQSLAQTGLHGKLKVLRSMVVQASAEQGAALNVLAGADLLEMDILGEAAGLPLHVSKRYFPLPRFAGMHEVVHGSGSITKAFATYGVTDYLRSDSRITARLPDAEIATWLEQTSARPVLMVTSVNVDMQNCPVEYAVTWFSGDRVTLTVNHHEL